MPKVSSLLPQEPAKLVPILSQISSIQFMISFNIILPSTVRFPELFYTGRRSGGESDANVGEELCKLEKERT